jgi:hypothetical protein
MRFFSKGAGLGGGGGGGEGGVGGEIEDCHSVRHSSSFCRFVSSIQCDYEEMGSIPLMRFLPPVLPAQWDNTVPIQFGMRREVMRLDMVHVRAFVDAWHLKDLLDIFTHVWILANELFVALEVHHIHLHALQL